MSDMNDQAESGGLHSSHPKSTDPEPAMLYKPLRIWPVVILLIGMVVFRYLPDMIEDGPAMMWTAPAFGPALCGIFILFWWLLISRARWNERLIGFAGV